MCSYTDEFTSSPSEIVSRGLYPIIGNIFDGSGKQWVYSLRITPVPFEVIFDLNMAHVSASNIDFTHKIPYTLGSVPLVLRNKMVKRRIEATKKEKFHLNVSTKFTFAIGSPALI